VDDCKPLPCLVHLAHVELASPVTCIGRLAHPHLPQLGVVLHALGGYVARGECDARARVPELGGIGRGSLRTCNRTEFRAHKRIFRTRVIGDMQSN
jgi:hypothetical protein